MGRMRISYLLLAVALTVGCATKEVVFDRDWLGGHELALWRHLHRRTPSTIDLLKQADRIEVERVDRPSEAVVVITYHSGKNDWFAEGVVAFDTARVLRFKMRPENIEQPDGAVTQESAPSAAP